MSRSPEQDFVFVPPIDSQNSPSETSEEGSAWQGAASEAYVRISNGPKVVSLSEVNDSNREVRFTRLASVNEFTVRSLELFNTLDEDQNKMVSRTELESAAANPRFEGQDAQVIAGLMERRAWDRMIAFADDQSGDELDMSREDLWAMGEKFNNGDYKYKTREQKADMDAIGTAYNAAVSVFDSEQTSAGM